MGLCKVTRSYETGKERNAEVSKYCLLMQTNLLGSPQKTRRKVCMGAWEDSCSASVCKASLAWLRGVHHNDSREGIFSQSKGLSLYLEKEDTRIQSSSSMVLGISLWSPAKWQTDVRSISQHWLPSFPFSPWCGWHCNVAQDDFYTKKKSDSASQCSNNF